MFGRLSIQPIIVVDIWLLLARRQFYPRPLYISVSNLLPVLTMGSITIQGGPGEVFPNPICTGEGKVMA
jgi:hypothetical protein